jgi:L-alanine-DL-glutamate epimerase-like enolase superfamily enzyme
MLIENAKLKKIDIPFVVSFKHSSAERSQTESVLVEMTSKSGISGYGESCPREYVTSESIESVKVFFNENILSFKNNVYDLDSLNTWLGNNIESIDLNPAAMCSIETAFLDLLSKNKGISIENVIGIPELQGHFKYTAVIGDSSSEIFYSIFKKYII